MRTWRTVDVPTDGGSLHVGIADADAPDAPTVLALHGVTSSRLAWPLLAEQCPHLRFLAPDLRGRGRSAALPGPYGLARHAADAARVLDAVGVEQAVVVGHSSGAFVAVVFTARCPERTADLLLVDGGIPLPVPTDIPVEVLTQALLGPALDRLSQTFADRAAYRAFWRAHPAFARDWSPAVEAYVDYDLTGTEPHLRSRVSAEAVAQDSRDQLTGSALTAALDSLRAAPLRLLRAPRGLQDEPPGLYPEPALESMRATLPGLQWQTVPEVNHYTVLLSERGARAVGAVLADVAPPPERTSDHSGEGASNVD